MVNNVKNQIGKKMAIAVGLEKLPKELLEPSEKMISVLDDSKKTIVYLV